MSLDARLLALANSIVGQYPDFSAVLFFLSVNPVTKGIPVILVIWSLWFVQRNGSYPYRAGVLATLMVAILAIILGRALSKILPFSTRPIHTPELDLHLHKTISVGMLDGMSSMPSDHAVLFASLCIGIMLINRTCGLLIGLYCLIFVLFPRVVFGLHWPSDILSGICVGAALALIAFGPLNSFFSRARVREAISQYEYLFYPAMFFLTFQGATMFNSARALVKAALQAVLM